MVNEKNEELLILRDLSDEELEKLSDLELLDLQSDYLKYGTPERATVKGLLKEYNIKYSDLSDFVLELNVGLCNYANRTKNQIYINRHNSSLKDNIVINLDKSRDLPYVTIQIQASNFIHEEAYTEDGLLLYQV